MGLRHDPNVGERHAGSTKGWGDKMGEHESQAGRELSPSRQKAGNPGRDKGGGTGPDQGMAERGVTNPPPGGRSSTSHKPDFRATVGRRLSEERELGPQVLSMLSPETAPTIRATVAGSGPSPVHGGLSPIDQRDEFLAELVQSMQAAMSLAHQQVVEEMDRRRTAQIDARRELAARADGRSQEHAEQEFATIDQWVETETRRIRLGGDARLTARRAELDRSIAASRAEVERFIEEVDTAIANHRATIDAFLDRIAAERDPATIARLVDRLPPPPALDKLVRPAEPAGGRAATEVTGSGLVGVMGAPAPIPTRPKDEVAEVGTVPDAVSAGAATATTRDD